MADQHRPAELVVRGDRDNGDLADTESLRADETRVSRPGATADQRETPKQTAVPAKKKRSFARILVILAVIAAVIGGVVYWWSVRNLETTDDAFTDGNAIAIAPHVSGYVTALDINDNQFVRKGDVLLQIDPRDYIAARDQTLGNLADVHGQLLAAQYGSEIARKNFPAQLAQAEAQLLTAKANLFKAQTDYQRQRSLPKGATTQQEVDTANAAYQAAQAQVAQAEAQVQQATPVQQNIGQTDARVEQLDGMLKQAQAQVDQANLNLDWTKVVAPQDGWVTKRNVDRGNYVQSGQSLLSLVTPQVWVTANLKESQLDRMRPGQKVDISVDAYPGLKLE